MNHKDRMLAGLPYKAWMDGLSEERLENKKKNRNRRFDVDDYYMT